MKKKIFNFLPFAFTITLICGLVYTAVQQDIRLSANDPQIGMAADAVSLLETSGNLVMPFQRVNYRFSTSPFLVIYDDAGTVVDSSGYGSDTPDLALPKGVFEYVRAHGEDRVTLKSNTGVRLAAVVAQYHASSNNSRSGFVLAARSLTEVEIREKNLSMLVFLAWLFTMICVYGALCAKSRFVKD